MLRVWLVVSVLLLLRWESASSKTISEGEAAKRSGDGSRYIHAEYRENTELDTPDGGALSSGDSFKYDQLSGNGLGRKDFPELRAIDGGFDEFALRPEAVSLSGLRRAVHGLRSKVEKLLPGAVWKDSSNPPTAEEDTAMKDPSDPVPRDEDTAKTTIPEIVEDHPPAGDGRGGGAQESEPGEWREAHMVLHSPAHNLLTITIEGRTLELQMVDSRGIVAPGAQLRRTPDGPPVPLLSKDYCHYSLYSEDQRIGSLSTCHPLGPHAVLMLDGHLIDVVPRLEASSPLPTPGPPSAHPRLQLLPTSPPTLAYEPLDPSPSTVPYEGNGVRDEGKVKFWVPDAHTPASALMELLHRITTASPTAATLNGSSISSDSIGDTDKRGYDVTASGQSGSPGVTRGQKSVPRVSSHLAKRQIVGAGPSSLWESADNSGHQGQPEIPSPVGGDPNKGRLNRTKRSDALPINEENDKENGTKEDEDATSNDIGGAKEESKKAYYFPRVHTSTMTVEIALFLDAVLLENLYSFYSEDQLIDLILSLINNAQAFFHQPGLGRRVDLTITQLYLLRTQPADLPTHNGDRLQLLSAFCEYQKVRVLGKDSNPEHWDLALYLSGLDLVSERETGEISDVTMGLTYTGGICDVERSCIISEFGTTNAYGRPFPSAGAMASLILTHEIGHSLGMRHDGSNNTCSSVNYLMASKRGPRGGTTWSTCSRDAIMEQAGTCLKDRGRATFWDEAPDGVLPGQRFDAVAQCQLFFRDHDATLTWPTNLMKLCTSVQCSSPHRLTSYLAGPAFEGTFCGGKSWCREGKCVEWGPGDNVTVVQGGLGMWEEGPCTSACLAGGTGWRESRQPCNNPKSKNSDTGCLTTTYQTDFCDDRQVCGRRRMDLTQALDELCSRVGERYPDAMAVGNQLQHSPSEPWRACVLYCRLRSNDTQVWTPRYLFQDDPTVPTHLPPGAPCHKDPDGTTYRCFHRTCVPHKEVISGPVARDMSGLFEYRDPPSLDDLVIKAGPPINVNEEDYPEFDLDDLF